MKNPESFLSLRIRLPLWMVLLLLFQGQSNSYGQATSSISGIVNTYHRVTEIIPAKACLRVTNSSGLTENMPVLILQMKGAGINTSNNSAFGDTTALNGAGNYEVGTICYLNGDSVFLFHHLLNNYDVSAKVQLVQFGKYYAATITDTLKAQRWDSASGTGGVIALYAEQSITLNAPVWADSSGYAGGAWYNNSGTCGLFQQAGTGFVYDITATSNLNGAYKGESVATPAAGQNAAKGAPANGGGGGNNHNNSGGGGANLSAGGDGGSNSSGTPTGCATTGNYGRGGKALSSHGGSKLFMGGGAGAGHANNGNVNSNYGGRGGGIVFIWANELIGNGYSISARGGKGGLSQADGAGGGGAGGTLVINIATHTGSTVYAVTGGAGGDSYNDISQVRCFGGGGGGSGGVVYFCGATPGGSPVLTSGGAGGQEFNRNAGCNAAMPGSAGSSGSIIANYAFTRSFIPAGYCHYLLPVSLRSFQASLSGVIVQLNWQLDHPEEVLEFIIERKTATGNWQTFRTVAAHSTQTNYTVTDPSPLAGLNFYRLLIREINGASRYSEIRSISFKNSAADFTLYPNPSGGSVTVSGNFADGKELLVTDISGKRIWSGSNLQRAHPVVIPSLPKGLYLVHYNGLVKKLVIH